MNGFQTDQDGDYIEKRPGSVLDYGFLWGKWLAGSVISSSVWDVPSPLAEVSNSHDDDSTAVVISGWVAGTIFTVKNTITAGPLTDSRTFRIVCVDH